MKTGVNYIYIYNTSSAYKFLLESVKTEFVQIFAYPLETIVSETNIEEVFNPFLKHIFQLI